MKSNYEYGLDILGADMGDVASFVPWLNVVSSIASSAQKKDSKTAATATKEPEKKEPDTAAVVRKALAQERVRREMEEAKAKAEASARRSKIIMYSVLGAVGVGAVGIATWAIVKKRR